MPTILVKKINANYLSKGSMPTILVKKINANHLSKENQCQPS
jgi:hypothetical protein